MRISDWSSDVCSSDLQFDVLRACLAGQARVVTLLLADRRAGLATIVVRRVEQRVVGQREQTVRDRIPGRAGVAVLKIGAATAADQQHVAAEYGARTIRIEHEAERFENGRDHV